MMKDIGNGRPTSPSASIVISVSGTPRPKQSARWINGRPVSVARTQKHLKFWTQKIVTACRAQLRTGIEPVAGAVETRIDFYFATPKVERHGQPHTHRPDRDNLEKAVYDALQAGGILSDDAKVAGGTSFKWWADKAGAVIELRPFGTFGQPAKDRDDDLGAVEVEPPAPLA